MDVQDLAMKLVDALETGDEKLILNYLAPNFKFESPQLPQPLSAQQWLMVVKAWRNAFPDLRYNIKVLTTDEDNGIFRFQTQLTGTHTGILDMSDLIPAFEVIKPSRKSISLPIETGYAQIRSGKLSHLHVDSTQRTGIIGILDQIGVEIPETMRQ
jgi:hypothetical protein